MPISFADAVFGLGVVSCAVAQAAILRSVLRMRRAASPNEGVPRPRFAIELAWAVVPAIALAALLFATWRTMHPVARGGPAAPAPGAVAMAAGGGS